MAGSPIAVRRPLAHPLSARRIEANRRNSVRSTGPRSPDGKARVARNAIKHGFFAAIERWSPEQHREFAETREDLRSEFQPHSALEESCVAAMAASCVKTAAILRYENIAALNFHRQQDRDLNAQIAASEPDEAARLENKREQLRQAGLWRPTIPAPKEALAIARYCGSLDRVFHRALSNLEELREVRVGGSRAPSKTREQSHYEASPSSVLRPGERPPVRTTSIQKTQKQTHYEGSSNGVLRAPEGPQVPRHFERIPSEQNDETKPLRGISEQCPEAWRGTSRGMTSMQKTSEQSQFAQTDRQSQNDGTNPLDPAFAGNRHERRRAQALARGR